MAPSLYAQKFLDMVATQIVEPIVLLIVGDDPDFLESACRFFQQQGYRVVATANAEQALAVQAKQHFHLAVIDQNKPGMNGLVLRNGVRQPSFEQEAVHLAGIGDAIPRESISKMHITEVMRRNHGNKTKAAKELGIARRSLYRMLEKFDNLP